MTHLIRDFFYSIYPSYSIPSSSTTDEAPGASSSQEAESVPILPGFNFLQSKVQHFVASILQNQVQKALQVSSIPLCNALESLSQLKIDFESNALREPNNYLKLATYLSDITHSVQDSPFSTLLEEQKTCLLTLNEQLQQPVITIDLNTVNQAEIILNSLRQQEEGWAQTTARQLKETVSLQFKTLLGITPEDLKKKLELKQQLDQSNSCLHQLRQRTLEPQNKPLPTDIPSAIEYQFLNFRTLSTQILLTKILFPHDNISVIFPEIFQAAQGLRSRQANISDEMAFKEILISTYHTRVVRPFKGSALFDRIYLQFHLHITLPIIKFYINYFFTQLHHDISTFLATTTDQKFEYLDIYALSPIRNHFSAVQNFLDKKVCLSSEVFLETSRDATQNFLSHISINGKSSQKILEELANYLSSRYIAHLPWTLRAKESISCALPQIPNQLINALSFCLKIIFTCIIYCTIRPLEWIIDILCTRIIEHIVKNYILPTLLPQSTSSSQIPSKSPFRHQINLILWQKFATFNNRDRSNDLPHPISSQPILSSLRYHQIKETIDYIFKAIALEHAMNDPWKIHQTLNNQISLNSVPAHLHQTLMTAVSPAASLEMIKVLETVLQQDFLSHLIWSALESGLTLLKQPPTHTSKEEMEFAEMARVNELQVTVAKAVEEAIQMALNPADKINLEIKKERSLLHQEIINFNHLAASCTLNDSQEIIQKWTKISHHISHLKFCDKEILQVIQFTATLRQQFLDKTNELHAAVQQMQTLLNQNRACNVLAQFLDDQFRFLTNTRPLTTDQILDSLNLLESTLSLPQYNGITCIQEFLSYLNIFIQNTKNYQSLQIIQPFSKEIFQKAFTSFKQTLAQTYSKLDQQAKDYLANTEEALKIIAETSVPLEKWIQEIPLPQVNPKDMGSLAQKITDLLGPQFKAILTRFLMSDINTLINMLDAKAKPNHWNALLWRGVGSYLETSLPKK
ncbi:MAG: hypothetical protein QRY72_03080 [Candidatus Rhabdochlamydia sp.]